MDGHGRLVVVGGGEDLAGLGRDGRVLGDQLRHDAAECLDTERQRGDVEQQHVLHLSLQHAALDRGTHRYCLVGVDVLARLLAEQFLDLVLHLGHARHAADEDHVADILKLDAGILDGHAAGSDTALDQVFHQRLELGAGDFHRQVLGREASAVM